MNASLWLDNVAAYSLQIAVLAAVGILLPRVLRFRAPVAVHRLLQVVLVVCLLLPALAPRRERTVAGPAVSARAFEPGFDAPVTAVPHLPAAGTILLILGAGAAARLLWLLTGLYRLRRYRKKARPLEALPSAVERLRERLNVRAAFSISEELPAPVTFGARRPVILLPRIFLSMDAKLQEAVACHELLHVRRGDWLWTLGEEVVRAVFWFHPLLCWLIERIRLTREQIVDALAVRSISARQQYVEALLAIAASPMPAPAAALSFLKKRHLKERVSLLVKENPMSKTRRTASFVFVCAATVAAGGLAVWSFPLETVAQESESKPAQRPSKEEKIHRVGNGVTAPSLIYKVEPNYTQEARDAGIKGTVVLTVHITPEGRSDNIQVLRSLDPGLDVNAVEAVRQWRFKPATKDGEPVTVKATIEINFRLD